jgi:hypothetical protein
VPAIPNSERSLQGRRAAHKSWANTEDPSERTRAGRVAFLDRFEREVDPDGTLPESDRKRRAEHAKKSYFAGLALKSARARRLKSRHDCAKKRPGGGRLFQSTTTRDRQNPTSEHWQRVGTRGIRCHPYAHAAIAAESDNVMSSPQGQRTKALYKFACVAGELVAGGLVDFGLAETACLIVGHARDIPDADATSVVESITGCSTRECCAS